MIYKVNACATGSLHITLKTAKARIMHLHHLEREENHVSQCYVKEVLVQVTENGGNTCHSASTLCFWCLHALLDCWYKGWAAAVI